MIDRSKQDCSYYLPDSSVEGVVRGLKCLQQEGYFFWSDLRNDASRLFRNVLEESESTIILSDSENDSDEASSGEDNVGFD